MTNTASPPRDGFFEHAEYLKVCAHAPASYRDVLDFAYYSGWRRNEILHLTWDEVDLAGGVTNEIRKCFAAMAFLSVNGEPRFVTRVESKGASPAAARLSPDGGAQFDPRSCA